MLAHAQRGLYGYEPPKLITVDAPADQDRRIAEAEKLPPVQVVVHCGQIQRELEQKVKHASGSKGTGCHTHTPSLSQDVKKKLVSEDIDVEH